MDANYGGIDHLQPTIMGLGDGIHEAVPNTCFAPSDKAIVAGGAWAVPLWQIAPWRTGSQHPEDAVQHAAVIHARHPACLARQHRSHGGPLIVRKFVAHDPSLQIEGLNQDPVPISTPQAQASALPLATLAV